jgi:threonine 3-dehydrogenase
MCETWAQMTALLTSGGLNLEPLFGEQRSFEDFEEAFRLLQGGFAGKVLLIPNA